MPESTDNVDRHGMKGDELATDLEETAKEIQGEVAVIRTSLSHPRRRE